ncbi:MAG TPA: hypothetical protein VMM36_16570 [Opitutaceae bacterium]|nr:hypothetical protein [Opitutaceae bacterium]
MRRLWLWIPLFIAFAVAIGFNLTLTPETPAVATKAALASNSPAPASRPAPSREAPSALAAGLNAPDGTVERDLLIVDSVFEAFRTNFPGGGNPVGENNEITAVLTGRNSLGLQLIPRGHPAINHRGELVDRWGTPFFFHQLSGDAMDIRSAGPDKVMHTDDDAVLAQGG